MICVAVGEDGSDDEVICNVVCDVDEWWLFEVGAARVAVVEFELGGSRALEAGVRSYDADEVEVVVAAARGVGDAVDLGQMFDSFVETQEAMIPVF